MRPVRRLHRRKASFVSIGSPKEVPDRQRDGDGPSTPLNMACPTPKFRLRASDSNPTYKSPDFVNTFSVEVLHKRWTASFLSISIILLSSSIFQYSSQSSFPRFLDEDFLA